jgi:hypothetical protein
MKRPLSLARPKQYKGKAAQKQGKGVKSATSCEEEVLCGGIAIEQ